MTDSTAGELTGGTFEPHRGTDFEARVDDEAERVLRLDEVTTYGPRPGAPRAEPFSLVFSASGSVLDQRTYRLEHPVLGALDIFLVPIGPDADGRIRYEAVFN